MFEMTVRDTLILGEGIVVIGSCQNRHMLTKQVRDNTGVLYDAFLPAFHTEEDSDMSLLLKSHEQMIREALIGRRLVGVPERMAVAGSPIVLL